MCQMGFYSALKIMNAVMCNYVKEIESHYALWTSLDTKIQVPYDFTHMPDLKCCLIEEKTGGFHMVGRDRETSLISGRI